MRRFIAISTFGLVTSTACLALSGCSGPHPFISEMNGNSVEINYAGDVDTAMPLARQACARLERVPQLNNAGANLATYDCIPR